MINALKLIDVYDLNDQNVQSGEFKRLITARNRCKKLFVEKYDKGFFDPLYIKNLRADTAAAHRLWIGELNKQKFASLLSQARYQDIARLAIEIASETSLLTEGEKESLQLAVRTTHGAQLFAQGLFKYLYSTVSDEEKFNSFCIMLSALPGHENSLLSWPVATVFGAIAQPRRYIFVKPIITRQAALKWGFPFDYQALPTWASYCSMLDFAACLRADLSDLQPRDLIDIQAFISDLGAS